MPEEMTPVPMAHGWPAESAALLLTALERRYLSNFEPTRWRIADVEEPSSRPRLRQILELGSRHDQPRLMPNVLTALHTPGQATVAVTFGDGVRHRWWYGGRRLAAGGGSTEDFLAGQAAALRANIPGLLLGEEQPLDAVALPDLMEFLQSAPALGVLTGVPSVRTGPRAFAQNIDRLVGALGGQRYAVVVVAEPVSAHELDDTLDRCRQLRGELHTLVRRSVAESSGTSTSESTSRQDEPAGGALPMLLPMLLPMALPMALAGLQLFCSVAGAVNPDARARRWVAPFGHGTALAGSLSQLLDTPSASVSMGTGTSQGQTVSRDVLDTGAEAGELLLQQYINRMEASRTTGWWRAAVYLAADSDAALAQTASALRSIYSGETGSVEPVRLVRPAAWLVREAMTHGSVLSLQTSTPGVGHPLGGTFDAMATCLTSDELAVVTAPPCRDVPGTPTRDVAEFALNASAHGPDAVRLGTLQDAQRADLRPVSLTGDALNRHVFITGMTGYGKTMTAQRLLLEAYTSLGVPFLVIEPVKAEYRALRDDPALRGRLQVFSIGGDLPLRLNPFLPVAQVPLARHIDLVKAVFNAAFPMFAGMSYVLEEALLEIYTERGWNLHTSRNDVLGAHPSDDDVSALVPTLADLHDKIDEVLTRKRYAPEVHQNMGAALRSRLRSLMVGTKGMTLNGTRSVPLDELFGRPCVIELRNLGDDEEKAFVMALLLCLLYEHAETRPATRGAQRLRHLTLIEEAHRLLRTARGPGGPETPDAQAKAVTMFTDMLAEMRAYGEGFLIADQIPTKLAPETLKNTNVKILHRLAAPDDRAVMASMANLTEAQSRHLATLQPGIAVVHDADLGSAVLVRITPPSTTPAFTSAAGGPHDRTYLHRNGGCRYCPAPCEFLDYAPRPDDTLLPFFHAVLAGTAERAWQHWTQWRSVAAEPGVSYCGAAQAAHRWLGTGAAARSKDGEQPSAADRLTRDRATREMGRLCRDWTARDTLDESGLREFATARQRLRQLLSTAPPRELPGCAACPSRCHVLPLVADRLAELAPSVAARATAVTPAQTRLLTLTALAERELPAPMAADVPIPAVLYCLVTNTTADRPADAEELLRLLAAPAGGKRRSTAVANDVD